MPTNILMPALSPTMTEGNLAKWVKNEGDTVEAGEVIAEIETDKATMEVEAVDEGKLAKILVPEGAEGVKVNAPIGILLEEDEDESALEGYDPHGGQTETQRAETQRAETNGAEESRETEPAEEEQQTSDSEPPASSDDGPSAPEGSRIFASPLARRLAARNNLDLSRIRGSGPHGRIVQADVEKNLKSGAGPAQAAASSASAPQSGAGPQYSAKDLADAYGMAYTEIPNSGIRKTIARRLLESKQTIPHFYLNIECRIDTLLQARKALNEAADGAYKLSVNDFIIKASAMALKAYPAANVAWTDQALLQFENADISVAVATPNGLITPIIKAAENKALSEISAEMKDLAGRARDGKLKPEEYQGGTFSVSNLGMYGIQDFSAIINPPQSCILAIGAGEAKPYIDEHGEIRKGTFMRCTLSIDHRAVDGAVGAEFLQIFKRMIENPVTMLV